MKACFTINRKKNEFHIYNIHSSYPLDMVQELKTQLDETYQQVANELVKIYHDERGHH